jgi:putative transposase
LASREERALQVGLFRYGLIRELADPQLPGSERGRLIRELTASEHLGPDGRAMIVGRSTLGDWLRAYRTGGFDALCPEPRRVGPLTPPGVLQLAEALKREVPARTAAQVHQVMLAAGEPVPTVRTLQRHFQRIGLNVRADGRSPDRVYGRFQAERPNELWTGDGLHGPKIAAGRRAVLLAFIDDHSRALTGYRWGTGEDVLRLEAALRPGLMARGVPDGILVDRGSAFVSTQLFRACAVLGIRLIHASPRAATTKGKIERFFRTTRERFLVELQAREVIDLRELNRLFSAWVEGDYHRRVHSETGQMPLERLLAGGPPRLPTAELLREAFLWSEQRTVTKTASVSLHANQYEVDGALVGRRCELIFDPFDLTRIEVRYQGRPMGLAVPLRIGRHTHPQARREEPEPPPATGIDFLGLLADRREGDITGGPGIDYRVLQPPPDETDGQITDQQQEEDVDEH